MPVLLTHGIGGSLELWDAQFADHLQAHRLIAWDMPGHGISDIGPQPYDPDAFARFAWHFLDALGIQRAVLAGNSLGAAVSVRMAGLAPDRVAGLVLANAATLGREVFAPFRVMTLPVLGELMNRPGPTAVDRQIQAIFHHPGVATAPVRAAINRNVHKPGGVKAFLATLRRMSDLGAEHTRRRAHAGRAQSDPGARAVRARTARHGGASAAFRCRPRRHPGLHAPGAGRLRPHPQLEKPTEFNDSLNSLVSACA